MNNNDYSSMYLTDWLTEDKWTKKANARDAEGNEVDWRSPEAEKFDLTTAIRLTYPERKDFNEVMSRLKTVLKIVNQGIMEYVETSYTNQRGDTVKVSPVWAFNDNANWATVQRALVLLDI